MSSVPAAPAIHPSRLAVSHVLRASDRKAKSGGAKEKTRAKQRYLKAKKERRKAKVKARPKGAKAVESKLEGEESDDDEEMEEDEEAAAAASVGGRGQEARDEAGWETAAPEHAAESPSESESDDDDETESITADAASQPPTALERFPAPRQLQTSDPALLAAQGLPAGLSKPTLVDAELRGELDEGEGTGLQLVSPGMRGRLRKLGVKDWFAVQTSVIPLLLSEPNASSLYPSPPLRDLCVSAPTGSGKTLAYGVPIVEVLSKRQVRQLRALVLLPTRDLVSQVRETLVCLAQGTGLSIGVSTGQSSFASEQAGLVDSRGRSKVDILIATPGRLIDHLDAGLTLQHLRFLVVDEADRLLGQSFHEWLNRVLDALEPRAGGKGALAPAWLGAEWEAAGEAVFDDAGGPWRSSTQKLLFSATLTSDPAKINALELRRARFVSVQAGGGTTCTARFALPSTLREHMLVVDTSLKPLWLLWLLHGGFGDDVRRGLCFVKSTESSARLVRLVELFEKERVVKDPAKPPLRVQEYSSELTNASRARILADFKAGNIDLLVCSDLIARGMDLPHVQHVISYDVAVDMAKYVHRVGRTARAGREGDAWSLVEEQEARYFKRMLAAAGHAERVEKVKVKEKDVEKMRGVYETALENLAKMYARRG